MSDIAKNETNVADQEAIKPAAGDSIEKVISEMRNRQLHNGFQSRTLVDWAERIEALTKGLTRPQGKQGAASGSEATAYTVFLVEPDGNHPTTYITSMEADSQEEAERIGIATCARDWDCEESDVRVLGVALGEVEILSWEDEPA